MPLSKDIKPALVTNKDYEAIGKLDKIFVLSLCARLKARAYMPRLERDDMSDREIAMLDAAIGMKVKFVEQRDGYALAPGILYWVNLSNELFKSGTITEDGEVFTPII